MDIDIKLNKVSSQIIMNFHYNVGVCLFDVISYLLNNSLTSSIVQQNCMAYLQEYLILGTIKALYCHIFELNV
jgi:hypothetical protein